MFASIAMLAEAAGEAAHEASKAGLPQLNPDTFVPQLFWLVLTFVTLLFVMSKIALPRVGEVIEERTERIQRDVDAAGRLKADTDKALADYEKALADARANASGIAKQTREKLSSETDAEKARAEAGITAKLAEAETRIAATKTKALTAVNDIAAETARAVVSKLVGQDVSLDDVKKVLQPAAAK
ncbi:MAG TPA: F0F1 ATP synthase subunit B' [Hyphomicrobium sp.]|nr:F0F1 ATP synthase subunit B' [Hyphomicrobium sp.]